MNEAAVTVQSLHVYPIKSCAGIDVRDALLIDTGFEFDRTWMLVDDAGDFLSQRELPRMALIRPTLRLSDLVLRAPGMLALHVALDTVEAATTARVWEEPVRAYDMGPLAARWFSAFLGREVRLVRFDPEQRRLSEQRWTGALEAENAFQDGFPLLVASTASLGELNRRMVAAAAAPVTMARFRPNVVLDGLEAHGEDGLDEIAFTTDEGPIRVRLVKPCARCPIPDVDPATGVPGHAVADSLAGYRGDPRHGGKVTFGMNAVIVEGFERTLRVGMQGMATIRFD